MNSLLLPHSNYSMGAIIHNLGTGSLLGPNARLLPDTKKEIRRYEGIMEHDEVT